MKWFFAALAVAVAVVPEGASASTIASLNDWCFNINGVNVTTNACNQSPEATLPANVNGSSFDFTLSSADPNFPETAAQNNLGSVQITLGPGAQYVSAYMDYDLNYDVSGSFTDYGTVNGTPGAGVSYEMDDPNSSSIFSDFAASALNGQNNVGTPSAAPCCDVSWALGVNLDLATSSIVTFTVSTAPPDSGFYLQQTNSVDTTQSIYLYESVEPLGGPGPGVPEPGSLVMLGAGLAGIFLLRRRIAA
jgi:hypothetical protein